MIPFSTSKIVLDSLSVVPASIVIKQVIPSVSPTPWYDYDVRTNQISFRRRNFLRVDSIKICYRVFPFLITDTLRFRNPNQQSYLMQDSIFAGDTLAYQRESIFYHSDLQTSGNITQGVSIGNVQNAQINSAINLQVRGNITKDMALNISLTDQNVPFQPDGNTQDIQDFDRIFLQVKHPNFTVTGGDIILKNSDSHFLKYYKNVQGASLSSHYRFLSRDVKLFKEKYPLKTYSKFSVSESKGQFYSQVIKAQEGVQGAYRLRGKNNERFIIVLAGSEKVYVDGQLLTRGFENDYLMDYNTAEITFTNNVPITNYTRIRVDFEYANQNFNRSIIAFEHRQHLGSYTFSANFYQEKDDPNSESARLTDQDKEVLKNVGDRLNLAVGTTAKSTIEYSKNLILYHKIDSIYMNQKYENIYVRTTNPNDKLYTVYFALVGSNQGDYVLDKRITANGRVFKWVAPINGIRQGNYAPIRNLPAPNLKSMIELGLRRDLSKDEYLFFNLAFSEQDKNLFSEIQNFDNKGFSFILGYQSKNKKTSLSKKYRISNLLTLEFDQKYFQSIDRFRSPDFDRDWSVQPTDTMAQDMILRCGSKWFKDKRNHFDYLLTYRNREQQSRGFQHQLVFNKKWYFFNNNTNAFYMNSYSKNTISDWKRISTETSYQTKWFKQGYRFSMDKNTITNQANDSIIGTAMFFDEHLFYIRNIDSAKVKFQIDYSSRVDQAVNRGKMIRNTKVEVANFRTKQDYKNQSLRWKVTYRNLKYLQNTNVSYNVTLLNNFDYSFNLLNRTIRSKIGLVNGTGRELLRAFRYLQVANGQGTHTWRDDNSDGIQNLEEFYRAVNPDEKNYIKIYTPTDNYVPAYTANFTYRLHIQPPKKWFKQNRIKKYLAFFEMNSIFSLNQKTTDSNFFNRFIPLLNTIQYEKLLSKRENIRTNIFYRRTYRKYGGEFSFQNMDTRTALARGFQSRKTQEVKLKVRYRVARKQNFNLILNRNEKTATSDFLNNRNYRIKTWVCSPSWTWQPNHFFRLEMRYYLKIKRNNLLVTSKEKSNTHELRLSTRMMKSTTRNINTSFRFILIDYNGEPNSPVGYEMLEALKTGKNYNLMINWRERLRNGLQLVFQYNGRKSGGNKLIHWGNMRAVFLF